MKVLQLTAIDFTVKKFLLPLVDEMEDQGYEVHVACSKDEIGQELSAKGYVIHHIPFSRNMNVFSHMKSLMKLIGLIRQEKYSIIHAHTPVASLIGRLAAKFTRTPLTVYTAHGFYFHEHMSKSTYAIAYSIEKVWARLFSDYVFFQSIEDYQLAVKKKFKKPDKLVHINNGVSSERFDPEEYDRDSVRVKNDLKDKIVFTFIGRLVIEKGVRELIEAFSKISENRDDVVLMVIGGGVTGDRDGINIENLVNAQPAEVQSKVKLMGLRDNIPELLSASDVFVLPSYREGLPRSIIEAMAMGKPVIATDIRGCREEVFEGINGYLCKAKSASSLASAFEKMLENDDVRLELGRNSRDLFLKEFDEKKVLERQMNVFNRFREVTANER